MAPPASGPPVPQEGQRIRLPGEKKFLVIDGAFPVPAGWRLFVQEGDGQIRRVNLSPQQLLQAEILEQDGQAAPGHVLAGLWAEWMKAASVGPQTTALATTTLRPYAHQSNAVYGAMLPQPRLRFLLADEPGTGKTMMAGLYLREMQRLGLLRRALIVVPAHLCSKWQQDFDRFFGGGLRRIRGTTVAEGALRTNHDLWIVSLDLLAVNPAVQQAVHPAQAGWDVVVFDEAHRLTPTAEQYYRVGEMLCLNVSRVLLMTATPHRGKEWLFRSLMHLVDPDLFPRCEQDDKLSRQMKPGQIHFLRRMKEDLFDYDQSTPLFKGRRAENIPISLNSTESAFYRQALDLVDRYFPKSAAALAKMVYGKRAASSLSALAETLKRRHERMGSAMPTMAGHQADPDQEDPPRKEEAQVVVEQSLSAREEQREIRLLLGQLEPLLREDRLPVSKWPRFLKECLQDNGILPGKSEQAVIFTEYADTADWLVQRLRQHGFSGERYSGRDEQSERDAIRARFANRQFQILVSTDAGNEGIDLQTAHVLVNWDIPWSLVTLEQRMGRIHRVGQQRDVLLYNLIAKDTREGEVLHVLLENFVVAANRLGGKIFDSLSLVAELCDVRFDQVLSMTYEDDPQKHQAALLIAKTLSQPRVEAAAKEATTKENSLRSTVDIAAAVMTLQKDILERINPRIVEAFLHRQSQAGLFSVAPHAAGAGLFMLTSREGALPVELGGEAQAIVATSGSALREAKNAGAVLTGVISLGPGEPGFRGLVDTASAVYRPALFRGGPLRDSTSVTSYDLFTYEVEIIEASGERRSRWPFLVRVDETGARRARWEVLANLEQGGAPSGPPHPAHRADADERAEHIVREEQQRRRDAYTEWMRKAQRELERLPSTLTTDIEDAALRRAERKRVEEAVRKRLAALDEMTQVTVGPVCPVGFAHVEAAGSPPDPKEADSEDIAMRLVTRILRNEGFSVSDIHTDGRGYDLHATRRGTQRCVEVKGIWGAASSEGIRVTGHELLIAQQLSRDYWVYVADECQDGTGRLFGAFSDPVTLFEGQMRDQTVVRIPGSALVAARSRSGRAESRET